MLDHDKRAVSIGSFHQIASAFSKEHYLTIDIEYLDILWALDLQQECQIVMLQLEASQSFYVVNARLIETNFL